MAWLATYRARLVVEAANRTTHSGELREPCGPLPAEAYQAAATAVLGHHHLLTWTRGPPLAARVDDEAVLL